MVKPNNAIEDLSLISNPPSIKITGSYGAKGIIPHSYPEDEFRSLAVYPIDEEPLIPVPTTGI